MENNQFRKEDIISKIQENKVTEAFILAYFYNKVCIGKYKNNEIYFNENVNYNFLTQIRIFNKDLEIKCVLDEESKEYVCSIIRDQNKEYFDEYMMVLGNEVLSSNDNFTTVSQIGSKIDLPFKVTEDEIKASVRLVVRNYFEKNADKQVIISESRLVGFTKKEGGDLIAEK